MRWCHLLDRGGMACVLHTDKGGSLERLNRKFEEPGLLGNLLTRSLTVKLWSSGFQQLHHQELVGNVESDCI